MSTSTRFAGSWQAKALLSAATPKSLHWLERSGHIITTKLGKDEVYQQAATFCETTVYDAVEIALPENVRQDEEDGTSPDH